MHRIPNWSAVIFRLCGGWWSATSGAVSIPVTAIGFFLPENPRLLFVTAGYCGLMVCAVRTIWINLQVTLKHEDELGEKRAQHVKEMAQLHQDLRAKGAENHNLKSEIAKLHDEHLPLQIGEVVPFPLRVEPFFLQA